VLDRIGKEFGEKAGAASPAQLQVTFGAEDPVNAEGRRSVGIAAND
jgi:hypothetical protein